MAARLRAAHSGERGARPGRSARSRAIRCPSPPPQGAYRSGGRPCGVSGSAENTGDAGEAARPSLVCVLPRGATPGELFEITDLALEVRTDQLVRFQAYSSSRHGRSRAGDILAWREGEFHALPPLQTIIRTSRAVPPRNDRARPSSRADERTGPAPDLLRQLRSREPAVLATGIQPAPARRKAARAYPDRPGKLPSRLSQTPRRTHWKWHASRSGSYSITLPAKAKRTR